MTDLTAPTDPIMADSVAALAVVRAGFDREADSIRRRADTFAADIQRLVADADGWDPVIRLAEQATP